MRHSQITNGHLGSWKTSKYWSEKYQLKLKSYNYKILSMSFIAFISCISIYVINDHNEISNDLNEQIEQIEQIAPDVAKIKLEELKFNKFLNTNYIDGSNILRSFMVMGDEVIRKKPITMVPDYISCDVVRCNYKYNFNESLVLEKNISNVNSIYQLNRDGVSYSGDSFLPQKKIDLDKVGTCQDSMSYLTLLEKSNFGDLVYGDKNFPLDDVRDSIYDGASKLSELNVKFSVPKKESLFFTKSLDNLGFYPVTYKLDEDRFYLETKIFCFD